MDAKATESARDAAAVTAYLEASMVPDPETAARYMAPGIAIVADSASGTPTT